MSLLTHNQLRITEREVRLDRLPPVFDGWKLVHISDLHFYEYTVEDYYRQVSDRIAQIAPEILVMTGDVVHYGEDYIPQAERFMTSLSATHGKFSVPGNHDYQDGANSENITRMLTRCGFEILKNRHTSLEHEGSTLWFAGVDDLWYGRPDIRQATEGVPEAGLVIMLAHNPLLFDPLAAWVHPKVDLVLGGHTHAGHVYIPFLGPIYRKVFRMKYRYGLYERNQRQLHVTSGLGSAAFYLKKLRLGFPRFRFNTHPEIAVLTLRCGTRATG